MRLQVIASALLLPGAALALSDSSPWVLLSTSELQASSNHNQIQTSPEVLKHTRDVLSGCPTDRYLLVIQPGVHAADLSRENGCAMPHLCRAVEDSRIKSRYTVSEVVGSVTGAGIADYIRSSCAQKTKAVSVDEVTLASLAGKDRAGALSGNDAVLANSIDSATKSDSYTILFYSTPSEPAYEPEFVDSLHMDLKRDMEGAHGARVDNGTQRDTRPLFEKYQFFTPGIFMGIVVALVLFSILGVGLRALGSLEVSYGAFEKEMGPAAQKKQQ
ncbi:ER protein BIG1 [Purpureocillium lavendulum]|uniref:Protein BIG1 n=1 Tax=Purpureocillium lavendulum TaxID=1247861 RepID=A0AB34FI41_9HYPO|nr:ER protein BIG1 [Purpureocillium lavendulum]